MCDKELLVAYLYDDIADADRARFEAHLRGCASCREELEAFRGLRSGLARWTPPQPAFDFEVVKRRKPSWTSAWRPAFGLAAAAVLLLAVAAALAHVEVRYGQDGLVVRTGWSSAPAPAPDVRAAAVQPASASMSVAPLQAEMHAIDQRLAALESSSHDTPAVRQVADTSRASEVDILRRVHDLLAQSESRQQQELALRIAQVIHDVDAQREADLARIQQGLGRIDAMTTAEAAAHRDLTSYILASTTSRKQP